MHLPPSTDAKVFLKETFGKIQKKTSRCGNFLVFRTQGRLLQAGKPIQTGR
jgi:hypothetical protein